MGSKPRRRIDKFMVIAIVVAVLAVGVIVYGYLRRAKIERLEREYLEQLAPAVPEPVAAGTDGVWSPFRIRLRNSLPVLAVKQD